LLSLPHNATPPGRETQAGQTIRARPALQSASAIAHRESAGLTHDPERLISYVLSNR
jgi:hypothetical protein